MPAEPSPGGATAAANLLLSFCPRQVLLLRNHQPPMAKTNTSSSDTTNALKPCKARTSDDSLNQHKLLLRRSIAAYLHKFGYSGTLSAFQSEAKVDDWGAQSLDLEQIFNKHLETSENPPEVITTKLSKQDPGKEVINKSKLEHGIKLNQGKKSEGNVETESKKTDLDKGKAEDGHEVEESHANPEEKKKKKSKVSSKTPADDIQRISQEVVHEGEGDDINLKLRDKKKKKEKKDNHENVVEAASEEKLKCKKSKSEPQVTELADGSDTQSKDKKKKKHKSLPDAEMMDSLKECSVVNDENGKDPELGETIVKSKEKKKEKRKSIPDSDVSDSKRRGHENGLGIDDKTDAKSNDKKKKKHKLCHDSDQTNPLNGGDENGFDVDRKDSKKRKRLASEEGVPTADRILAENVSVTKKEAVEGKKDTEVITKEKDSMSGLDLNHSKKRKVEKSEEGLINTKGTAPDTKNKEGLTEDGESDKVDANVSKNGKSGVSQNTMKKEQNGSAEPKTVNAFRRVKADEVKFADERLQNNSYWAKDGADTGYGAKAQEVLGQVRGRDFRHEKTKKKRGSYRGGQIDLQSHSIKFNYSDEE